MLLACAAPADAQPDRSAVSQTTKKDGVAGQQRAKKGTTDATKKAAKEDGAGKKAPPAARRGPPIVFYLAKGEPHTCGPGCSEWIAAEGDFDRGAVQRLRALLDRLGPRNLPIYFHSPGGLVGDAIEIGQMMRARKMTAGVGRTVLEGCEADAAGRACQALKRSGRDARRAARRGPHPVQLRLRLCAAWRGRAARVDPRATRRPRLAHRVRVRSNVPVSLNHPVLKQLARDRLQANNVRLAAYVRAMGIDQGLLEAAQQIKPEQVRFLTRDEIARYGIDTRAVVEGAWMLDPRPAATPAVVNLLSEGRDGTAYRNAFVRLACTVAKDQLQVAYGRERMPGDVAFARPMKAATGGGDFDFRPEPYKAMAGKPQREVEVRDGARADRAHRGGRGRRQDRDHRSTRPGRQPGCAARHHAGDERPCALACSAAPALQRRRYQLDAHALMRRPIGARDCRVWSDRSGNASAAAAPGYFFHLVARAGRHRSGARRWRETGRQPSSRYFARRLKPAKQVGVNAKYLH